MADLTVFRLHWLKTPTYGGVRKQLTFITLEVGDIDFEWESYMNSNLSNTKHITDEYYNFPIPI